MPVRSERSRGQRWFAVALVAMAALAILAIERVHIPNEGARITAAPDRELAPRSRASLVTLGHDLADVGIGVQELGIQLRRLQDTTWESIPFEIRTVVVQAERDDLRARMAYVKAHLPVQRPHAPPWVIRDLRRCADNALGCVERRSRSSAGNE
jgi:hypothetical protein